MGQEIGGALMGLKEESGLNPQHTSAPWSLLAPKRAGGDLGDYSDRGIVAGGALIGEMWRECPTPAGGKHLANAEANANFAVLAVNCHGDLLEALSEIVRTLSAQDDEGMIEHAEPMRKARAAILKATGTQS